MSFFGGAKVPQSSQRSKSKSTVLYHKWRKKTPAIQNLVWPRQNRSTYNTDKFKNLNEAFLVGHITLYILLLQKINKITRNRIVDIRFEHVTFLAFVAASFECFASHEACDVPGQDFVASKYVKYASRYKPRLSSENSKWCGERNHDIWIQSWTC